jgi:hypothetical protein
MGYSLWLHLHVVLQDTLIMSCAVILSVGATPFLLQDNSIMHMSCALVLSNGATPDD